MGNQHANTRRKVLSSASEKASGVDLEDAIDQEQKSLQLVETGGEPKTDDDTETRGTSLTELKEELNGKPLNEVKGSLAQLHETRDELIDLYGEKKLIKKKRAQFRKDMDLYEELLDPEGYRTKFKLRTAKIGNLTMKEKMKRIRNRLRKKTELKDRNAG